MSDKFNTLFAFIKENNGNEKNDWLSLFARWDDFVNKLRNKSGSIEFKLIMEGCEQ